MIYESGPWKEELLRLAEKLTHRYNQKRWPERSLFLLEKELFLGFFSVRKLIESRKISAALIGAKVDLTGYPAGKKNITLLNQHRFPELYELNAGNPEILTYEQICNQFIHSSIVAPFIPRGASLVGVFISSDWARKKTLYYIQLSKIIEIFKSIGSDEVIKLEVKYDEKMQDYIVTNSTSAT